LAAASREGFVQGLRVVVGGGVVEAFVAQRLDRSPAVGGVDEVRAEGHRVGQVYHLIGYDAHASTAERGRY
jgi:hypothetical protein